MFKILPRKIYELKNIKPVLLNIVKKWWGNNIRKRADIMQSV
jgi:hypothetical protein